jgi:hypothetical protein
MIGIAISKYWSTNASALNIATPATSLALHWLLFVFAAAVVSLIVLLLFLEKFAELTSFELYCVQKTVSMFEIVQELGIQRFFVKN